MSISSPDDTYSTMESEGQYDPENHSALDMHIKDDVDSPWSMDWDGDVDIERDGDNDEEDDEEEEDQEKEEDGDEEEEDGKQPQKINQGEMVNTSPDDVDNIIDHQPIVLTEHGQEMCEHSPRPHPLEPTSQR